MKRTLITANDTVIPEELRRTTEGARLYDSSCSPEARVIFIDKDGGYYLKSAAFGELKREAEMTRYFHSKGLGAEVLAYITENGRDYLLTSRVAGEDCTYAGYTENPKRLCDTLAVLLRELHGMPTDGCPVTDRCSEYFRTVDENRKAGRFDGSYLLPSLSALNADAAYRLTAERRTEMNDRSLLHGDYCLPNIMLDGWRLSGFIDVGNGGIGDRHIDLYWGAWTLNFNLHTDRYRDRFFDAYGRDRVDTGLIEAVSAAECFG